MIRHKEIFKALAVLLVLAGCRPVHRVASPSPSSVSCGAPIAGEEQLSASLVLVGEIHGTREIPAAFGHLICRSAAEHRGETVLVGLEILVSAQSAIDAFLSGEGDAAAVQALLAQEFWQREYQDGRSSEAMLHLLAELHRLRKAGLRIEVRALDPQQYDSPAGRDVAMATSLADAIAVLRPAQTLVLVGNIHSRTLNGYPWDARANYVPLGALLKAQFSDLTTLDITTLGGSVWTCTSASAADCGIHTLRSAERTDPVPRIALDSAAALKTGYSGVLHIGVVTASAPARGEPDRGPDRTGG